MRIQVRVIEARKNRVLVRHQRTKGIDCGHRSEARCLLETLCAAVDACQGTGSCARCVKRLEYGSPLYVFLTYDTLQMLQVLRSLSGTKLPSSPLQQFLLKSA